MKQGVFLACLSMFFLTGCHRSDSTFLPQRTMFPVSFSISLNKEVLPFSKSIPEMDIPEPSATKEVPGGDHEVVDLCSRIDYIVYASGTEIPVRHRQFTQSDSDFGVVYDSLPAGSYKIVFIAHSSAAPAALSSGQMSFGDVSDTFHAKLEQEIGAGAEINTDVTLYRIVGKVEVMATDTVPRAAKSLALGISRYPEKIDVLTGRGIAPGITKNLTHTFTTDHVGAQEFTHGFLTFIPAEGNTMDVRVTSANQSDQVIRTRNVENMLPIANQTVRYSGVLFHLAASDDTFELSLHQGGDWGPTTNHVLPE